MAIHLKLLGPFEARTGDGRPVLIPGKRPQALLAYLAMPAGRMRPRSELAALLWGRRDDLRARHSLSQVLTRLRGWLGQAGPDLIVAGRDEVMLDAQRLEVDAAQIEPLARDGSPAALASAAEIYRGDFLEGVDLKEEPFEDWVLARRYELRETAIRVLRALSEAGEPGQAIAAAKRLLSLSPLDEAMHRRLMTLQLATGRPDLALLQYERCRDVLHRELGTEPDAATRQLHREARALAGRAPGAPPPRRAAVDQSPGERTRASPWQMTAPTLPERASIAVLPFDNRSGDPEREFFSEGITEDIITALSRFRGLFVIARNSSFAYRGRAVDIEQIGRDLGVHYLLQGSVRRASDTLRVTAEVVDAATGRQVWAEKYDRPAQDVFALQDEVAGTIVATLVGRLEDVLLQQARRKPAGSLAAYELVLRGRQLLHRHRRSDELAARALFEEAVALDPDSAFARCQLALTHFHEFFWDDSRRALERAAEIAAEALELDDSEAWCHMVLGLTYLNRRQFDLALRHCETSVGLNPNDPGLAAKMGLVLTDLGRPDEAIGFIEKAMRLNPFEAESYCDYLGLALFAARRYREAIRALEVERDPKYYDHTWLAACYAQLGDLEQARRHGARAVELAPDLTVDRFARMEPIRDPADLEHWVAGMRLAGMP
jgi:TolB-like protein/DNA-binding SARP family transcriptional activator/Flp pilus assembly protein TadD